MSSKQKISLIVLLVLFTCATLGSFTLIQKNKETAQNFLNDINTDQIEVTCQRIDAGLFSIGYNDIIIKERRANNTHEKITIDSISISKTPSLSTIINRDLNQGKTNIECTGIHLPLSHSIAKQYGANAVTLNLSGSSTLEGTNLDTSTFIEIPEMGSATSSIDLELTPKFLEVMNDIKSFNQRMVAQNISLKSVAVTLANNGGVKKLLASNNVGDAQIAAAEKELQKVPAFNYQADLKSFVEGKKKLSFKFGFPEGESVPLGQLLFVFLLQNPSDASKVVITSF